ncbi:MAG: hypothetical protein OHK0057_31140 [Thermoflexibacter sp.]
MKNEPEEVVMQTDEYKKYLRSADFFVLFIIAIISALVWTASFVILAFDDADNIVVKIVFLVFAMIGVGVMLAGFLGIIAHVKDAQTGKVKVRLVELQGAKRKRANNIIHYKFQDKLNLSTLLPKNWHLRPEHFPQKAVIILGYYSNTLLSMELLESDEKFSVLDKK